MKLKKDTEIHAARAIDRWGDVGEPVNVLVSSDWDPQVWIAGFEFGPTAVIVADSFESAWGEWIDSLPEIDHGEVPEAYGFDGWDTAGERTEAEYSPETVQARFDAYMDRAENGECEYPELIEGYEYAPNGGIVSVGHYAWLGEYDPDRVRLYIRRRD